MADFEGTLSIIRNEARIPYLSFLSETRISTTSLFIILQVHQVATNMSKSGMLQLGSFANMLQLVKTTCKKLSHNKF